MNRIYEGLRIEPLMSVSNTVVTTSVRKILWTDDVSMGFHCRIGGAAASGTAMSCTAANVVQFSITEATASTHAGSVITGATMSLGIATAYKPRHADALAITMTSAVTTSVKLHINGLEYYCTVSGVGSSGENVAGQIASAINGAGTFTKLPHYSAVPNFSDTGIVLIYPDDSLGTGLTLATAGATDFKPRALSFSGMIEIQAGALSTNSPKWIGVSISSNAGASCSKACDCIRIPANRPGFSGLTTFI